MKVIEQVASKWEEVATRLHFKYYNISGIERDYPCNCKSACHQMFSELLSGKGRKLTNWATIIKVLKELAWRLLLEHNSSMCIVTVCLLRSLM